MPEKGYYGMCQVVGDLVRPLTEIIQEAGVGVKVETDWNGLDEVNFMEQAKAHGPKILRHYQERMKAIKKEWWFYFLSLDLACGICFLLPPEKLVTVFNKLLKTYLFFS